MKKIVSLLFFVILFSSCSENKKELQAEFENKKKEISKKLEEKLEEVDKEIKEFKKKAIGNINSISTEIAKELVKTVAKTDTNNTSASTIVDEVSKQYLRGLN